MFYAILRAKNYTQCKEKTQKSLWGRNGNLIFGSGWKLLHDGLMGEGRNWREVSIWKSTKQFQNDLELRRVWIEIVTMGIKRNG